MSEPERLRRFATLDRIARLGNTDLDVFPLCLGGNVFGWTIDEERSFAVLDAYVEAGGNFIDTADIYGRRGPAARASPSGSSAAGSPRAGTATQLVIATKVGMSPDLPGLSEATIRQGIEGSLERLGIDSVDLYYAHSDDPDTPLEETLGAFGALSARARSAMRRPPTTAPRASSEALRIGEREGMASYVALQPHYNLMERGEYEGELAEVCERHGLACSPTSAWRGAFSPASTAAAAQVDSPRAAGVRDSYFNERGFAVLDALDEIAAAHGTTVAAVALAWLLAQPTVLAPIASATSPEQLAELLPSAELELSATEIERSTQPRPDPRRRGGDGRGRASSARARRR